MSLPRESAKEEGEGPRARAACTVHFLPNDVRVEVPAGTTILEAAHKGDIYINSICGGDGICGKCKVIVSKGEVSTKPTTLLSRDEVRENYVLACHTMVQGDLEVLIPEETRLEGGKILLDEDARRFSALIPRAGEGEAFHHDPPVKKIYLELAPPTMEDATADHERVYDAIRARLGDCEMQTGYQVLRGMPTMLRDSNWHVTATVAQRRSIRELVQLEKGNTSGRNYGIAVDVGTTTVVATLVDLSTSQTLESVAKYNGQMKYGEDYIARIIYVVQNHFLDEMRKIVVQDINELIELLVQANEISLADVTAVMCAGNTAMIHFLLGLDPARIRSEPYIPSANFVPPIRAAEVGIRINSRGLLYCLPSVAAYVGSDITAGTASIRFDKFEELSMFVDIGTNGEVVLGNKEWMVCCSASAGPAFEGSGVRHGMRAARGAIEKIKIDGSHNVTYETIDNKKPKGICGSGLLDGMAQMLLSGVIDRSGTFEIGEGHPRFRMVDDVPSFLIAPSSESATEEDIVITQHDILNLMRSKAAVYAALSVLLGSVELSVDKIQRIYLAGGFGNYLDPNSAITIGMLPDMPHDRITFVGNTSAAGATMALLSQEACEAIEAIARKMTYFDMMGNARFMDEFVSANFFPHTRIEQFPSVAKALERAGGKN